MHPNIHLADIIERKNPIFSFLAFQNFERNSCHISLHIFYNICQTYLTFGYTVNESSYSLASIAFSVSSVIIDSLLQEWPHICFRSRASVLLNTHTYIVATQTGNMLSPKVDNVVEMLAHRNNLLWINANTKNIQ